MFELDRLPELCRDPSVRELMREATQCYVAGAHRACIVTTWIAVVFDYYAKLRELDLHSEGKDAEVRSRLVEFEAARKAGDAQRSLALERRVLDDALRVFEFVSPLQHEDLERLRTDRHRCAHPAMRDQDERYDPTPELARMHMRNAVEHLFSRQPVQGKAALDLLHRQVGSPLFPPDVVGARRVLSAGPLGRARQALVRNFVLSLLKEMLVEGCDAAKARRLAAAIEAVAEMYPQVCGETLREQAWALRLEKEMTDQNPRVWRLLSFVPTAQESLSAPMVEMLSRQASRAGEVDNVTVIFGPTIRCVTDVARERIGSASEDTLRTAIRYEPRPDLVERAMALFLDSGSWNAANARGNDLVLPLIRLFTSEQARRLVDGAGRNGEVQHSFVWQTIHTELESAGLIDREVCADADDF